MPHKTRDSLRNDSCPSGWKPRAVFFFRVISGVLACLIALTALVWLGGKAIRWKMTASFREFRAKGTEYHAQVAQACEELVSQLRSSGETLVIIKGTNQSLHRSIQSLNPQRIQVLDDAVSIWASEPTRGGFGIVWQRQATNPCVWELKAGTEVGFEKLYSKTNEVRNP